MFYNKEEMNEIEWSWLRMAIGNEEQMAQVRALMATKEKADEVNQGDKATNTVKIDFTSESGAKYEGKIIFKRPNVLDTMKMGGKKTQILQQAGIVDKELADDGVMMMAQALATLEFAIVKCPEWLVDMNKVEDIDVIYHVYGQYRIWEYSFRLNGRETQDGDSKTSAGA